jgi:hypothetical protein
MLGSSPRVNLLLITLGSNKFVTALLIFGVTVGACVSPDRACLSVQSRLGARAIAFLAGMVACQPSQANRNPKG